MCISSLQVKRKAVKKTKATAPRGAAARYTFSRTDFGGGYFLCLGGEHDEKTEEIQADKVHGKDLTL